MYLFVFSSLVDGCRYVIGLPVQERHSLKCFWKLPEIEWESDELGFEKCKIPSTEAHKFCERQKTPMFIAVSGLIQLLVMSMESPLLEFLISKILTPERNKICGESCKLSSLLLSPCLAEGAAEGSSAAVSLLETFEMWECNHASSDCSNAVTCIPRILKG